MKRIFVLSVMSALLAFGLSASSAMASHEHPVSGSPLRVPLVPAFKACTSADSVHGAPLNFPSCSDTDSDNVAGVNPEGYEGPDRSSSTVQMGAGSVGSGWLIVCNTGNATALCNESAGPPTGFTTAMQPDVRIFGSIRDVQCTQTGTPSSCSAGSDYNPNGASGPYTTPCTTAAVCGNAGRPEPFCAPGGFSFATCQAGADITLTAALGTAVGSTVSPSTQCGTNTACLSFASHFVGHALRVTDHYNCDPTAPGGDANACPTSAATSNRAATMVDILLPVPVDCIPTVAVALGSVCGVNTTSNALVPGSVLATKQAVVEVGEIVAYDSGSNGARGDSNDEIFATQGLYLP